MKIPQSDTETQLKEHLRQAIQIVGLVGVQLGSRADQHSQMAARSLVEVGHHIEQAAQRFTELRN